MLTSYARLPECASHTSTTVGGYKESGWGREMGHQVLENYLETKSVITRLG